MPSDLTIFAARYLVFIDAALAAAVILWLLWRRPVSSWVGYGIAAAVLLVLSVVFAHIGAAVYSDPRPFTQDHIKPLISHAADNGFPSDHALLAAAIVALVGMLSLWWALQFVVLGILVDWARVGAGIHH
ncbi:MAG: phosphatase PAP2 family protein, partial [Chloroflexota bacterium]